jgi:hypothetical protein
MSMALQNLVALALAAWALSAAGGAVAAAAPTPTQIYECIDARGAREYAQICSAGTVTQRVVQGTEQIPAAPETKSPALLEAEFKKRQQERQDAEAKAADDLAKAETAERNCTQARAQYKALVEGQRMQRVDPATGALIFLSDEERAADAERQRQLAEQWCKKPD